MAKKIVQNEIENWIENTPDSLSEIIIEISDITEDEIYFTIGENDNNFSIIFGKNYPKIKEGIFLNSKDPQLLEWKEKVNESLQNKKTLSVSQILELALEKYLDFFENKEDILENENFDGLEDVQEEISSKPKNSKVEIDKSKFLEIGSAQATLRLINDLKNIKKEKSDILGFSAEPMIDPETKLENLYHWKIKLFGFDKKSSLYSDLQKYEKISGVNYILLEMKFSKDYPHVPPFVRVVKPRFQFRTGHVTIGGSICMELLTKSGWSSTNDIESIIIQIRAEMADGGARLDPGNNKNYEYSEQEAWDAFYRAAQGHGWDTKGLNKEIYNFKK